MRFISFLFSLLPFDELYIGDLDFQDVFQKRLQILLITHHHAEHVVIHNRQLFQRLDSHNHIYLSALSLTVLYLRYRKDSTVGENGKR